MVRMLWIALIVIMSSATGYAQKAAHTFVLGDSSFLLDGKPFVMISGELHYPRIPKEAWRDRMRMAKAMGLNTIGTYVFWNLHEPEKGKYDFTGNNDIAQFVRIAQEEGLWVVLRPSPYVCAEWEFGGYPYWLQNEEGLVVRSLEPKFLNAYKNYIREVAKQLAPLQINHGGNVLMVQVENEYGFYSNDKEYLEANRRLFIDAGFDGLLYTCDPAAKVKDGHIPGLLPAVNGVLKPAEVKKLVRTYHGGKGPFYVAEWYPAWFDWWGTKHHTVPAADYTPKLDSLLAAGISVNMYMFHGGTTRDFMNGANYNDQNPYEPQISSYDYDAPLDEAGNATAKFMAFREVISKHLPKQTKLPAIPEAKPSATIGDITLTEHVTYAGVLGKAVKHKTPLTFEDLKHPYGYMLYRTNITGGRSGYLKIDELRDYGVIYVNGKKIGTLDRRLYQDSLHVSLPKGKVTIEILVENMGRINFGPYLLKNKKGITKKVTFNNEVLVGWEMYPLSLQTISSMKMSSTSGSSDVSIFRRGQFQLKKAVDTYLDLRKWGKGSVWINGHHLGRYWSIGPQQTVYVPAEWLKVGSNEVVIFDLTQSDQHVVPTLDKPILGQLGK
ncbi:glycoside hydrolase family 35 protein [Pseudochryseolinea flava]|uniref:Beta-galactosidase n=1 Tax=Pseudochryseolinea flava TaxID=2059302 RepID=A0A364Y655_9BACT|nr:beta-galactosidase family protein [Pseudochryseolinea flava]RAW02322.1 beta-galactosidase [Pseudochryseolinea flava]